MLVVLAAACSAAATRRPARTTATSAGDVSQPVGPRPAPATMPGAMPGATRRAMPRTVRIALARAASEARLSSDGEWRFHTLDGTILAESPRAGESWIVDAGAGRVTLRREQGTAVAPGVAWIVARPMAGERTLTFNGRRWRGELWIGVEDGDRLLIVNRLPMDDYLKGVVPLEIGTRAMGDFAAAEAQAVAARSYAYMHLAGPARHYDMLATVSDQVYGGVDAETMLGTQAVDNTSGLVLQYDGRVVNAPYHGNCGGFTAEPGDSWRTGPEPYLRRVSDQIPGTDRFYCETGPKYRWTRRYTGEELRQSIVRYLRTVPRAPVGVGVIRSIAVSDVTPAGRVAALTVDTDRGRWTMRGNEIRSALRTVSGEMLYSTYFSVYVGEGSGAVQSLELRGGGNGHGIGMCQSGAIGRARAGQDFRTILTAYYPGTTIGTID